MAPTTADLIEALRREGESYEDLAARLPISLSTVNRWKKRSPDDWEALLQMLEMAGWLNVTRPAQTAGLRPLTQQERDQALADVTELAALLQRLLEALGGGSA